MLKQRLEGLLKQDEGVHDSVGQIEFVRSRYNWDSAVEQLLCVYEDVRKKGKEEDRTQ